VKKDSLEELIAIMKRLRGPYGCPWDREQTLESIVPFIIEEAYEVVAAIDDNASEMLKKELGDLLFQIIFVCQLSKEKEGFDIYDVITASIEKMTRRHPHVFGDKEAKTSREVMANWVKIKAREQEKDGGGYLAGIPEQLPALMRAHKVAEKASRVGFDWKDVDGAFDKVEEEIGEFKNAIHLKDRNGIKEEFGDILFSLVNVSRFIEVNPEDALRKTIGKFIRRFHQLEENLKENGKDIEETSVQEMNELWDRIKSTIKS
jgi:MazG family protein